MAEEGELKKCWSCCGFYRGPLRDHVCVDGTTHTGRMSKPTRQYYDASQLELTVEDIKMLKGMLIKPQEVS